MNQTSPDAAKRTLPEPRTEPRDEPWEVWLHTKELGWFRSAVRGDEEEANRVAEHLRKNFDKVEVR